MKHFELDEDEEFTPLPAADIYLNSIVSSSLVDGLQYACMIIILIVTVIILTPTSETVIAKTTASTKAPVPSGVLEDISMRNIYQTQGCFRQCYRQTFNDFTPSIDILRSQCKGDWLFLGAQKSDAAQSGEFIVGAFGHRDVVFQDNIEIKPETVETKSGVLDNKVYWYGTRQAASFLPAGYMTRSIGFAASDSLEVSAEDDTGFSTTCSQRLTFALDPHDRKKRVSGAADCKAFNIDDSVGQEYYKIILTNTCPVESTLA